MLYLTKNVKVVIYFLSLGPVMESRDLVSVSRRVSRPVFWSLDLGIEGLRSRLSLELFVSRLCIGYFL